MKKIRFFLSLLLVLALLVPCLAVSAADELTGIKFTMETGGANLYMVNTGCTSVLTAEDVVGNKVTKKIEVYNLNDYVVRVGFDMQVHHVDHWVGPHGISPVNIPAKTGVVMIFEATVTSEKTIAITGDGSTAYYDLSAFFPRLNIYSSDGSSTVKAGTSLIVRGLPDYLIGSKVSGNTTASVKAAVPADVSVPAGGLPKDSDYVILSGDSCEAMGGQKVSINVMLTQNPGLKQLKLQLKYPEYLTLTGVDDGGLFASHTFSSSLSAKPYALSFSGASTKTGKLITLHFTVAANAPQSELVAALSSDGTSAALLSSGAEAPLKIFSGGVKVKSAVLVGDVNGDGSVTGMDTTVLSRYLAGWKGYETKISVSAADVNGDGLINGMDRTLLARYNAGWSGVKSHFTTRAADKIKKMFYSVDESQFLKFNSYSNAKFSDNLIPKVSSDFNDISSVSSTAWTTFSTVTEKSIDANGYNGTKALKFSSGNSWSSMSINLAKFIKNDGMYRLSFHYKIAGTGAFSTAIRTDRQYSFAQVSGSNIFASFAAAGNPGEGNWGEYTADFIVAPEDLPGKDWTFCLHMIADTVTAVWIDDFSVRSVETSSEATETVTETQTWIPNEISLISTKTYANPYTDVDVDLILTNGKTTYTIPGFWDGANIWRVRFVCPTAGTWTYKTVCTNTGDAGLHNVTGSVNCAKYTGELAVYKHGYVKTVKNQKYFVYDDGTPFFYLGDTHWSLGTEPLDHIQKMTAKRVKQGYTVIQSEPLGATFNVADGMVSASDILGFRVNDDKFQDIASKGLVHANAEFFFPSEMESLIQSCGGYSTKKISGTTVYEISDQAKTALKRLARYWVARYAAYPVMWTLGQEVDKDFYSNRDSHPNWNYANNPYKLVAEYIGQVDPYKHPLSGHQEGASVTNCSGSAFRDVSAHTWYAAQWSATYSSQVSDAIPKDYWNNGQGKPVVDYEGKYCYLWTKNFGARLQGYMAYLNGMFGYGWGGQDTWSYLNSYNEDAQSSDGVDTITSEDKKNATWSDSLEYDSAYQVGYMRYFFEKIVGDWYSLVPRFNDVSYLVKDGGAFAFIAGNDRKTVIYFYNFSDTSLLGTAGSANATKQAAVATGTVKKLAANTQYQYLWFSPVTGDVTGRGTFTSDASGSWRIGMKNTTDMVLYIYR